MAKYDVLGVFTKAPQILGMELTMHGDKWMGPYYMNGDKHPFRRDKLKVAMWKNEVWVFEEGGDSKSITQWLIEFGGASDYWDAVRILRGMKTPITFEKEFRRKVTEVKYVNKEVLEAAKRYDVSNSPLFKWMCSMFPEQKVREVWDKYNVTSNFKHQTVFWYVDPAQHVCFDKRIYYKEDGHRNKELPMGREYRIGDGYSSRCFFGSHLDGKVRGVVESEKTVLMCACYFGGKWLATGGKGNTAGIEGDMKLYPDVDAFEDWSHKGDCVPWFESWPEHGEHSDLADFIEWKKKSIL